MQNINLYQRERRRGGGPRPRQMRLGIALLLLLPMKQDGERTHQALASGLAVNLQRLDLRDLFPGQPASDLPEPSQAFCIGAVGAALRQEKI